MAQQQSPWLEGAYGWSFGEGGWNTGMDSNLLKFSFMFDRNVDSIVASLPAAVNGQAHFLTTDNRLYFAVGTTYFSTPVPKWFTVAVRGTGAIWQFNGTALIQIDSPAQLDSRLDAVELTVSNLGTAAFEDVEFFATQAELDVASATAAAYTDTLRTDIADTTNASKGAGQVGFLPAGTGAVGRTSLAKMRELVSPSDFGAAGDDATDDRVAINSSIQSFGALGGRVVLNRATYKLSAIDGSALLVDKPVNIAGENAIYTALNPSAVTSTDNTLTVSPSASFANDLLRIQDVSLHDPSTGTRVGNHGIFANTQATGQQLPKFTLRDMIIGQGSNATGWGFFHLNSPVNNVNGGMYGALFQNLEIKGGMRFESSGDSNSVVHSILSGTRTGVWASLVAGASLLEIQSNNITTAEGAIHIDAGSRFRITGNNIEHLAVGAAANNNSSVVDINGADGVMYGGVITENLISAFGSTDATTLIRLRNCRGTLVQDNVLLSGAAGVTTGIDIGADCQDVRVGANTYNSITNKVVDAGVGTMGVVKTAALVNGWVAFSVGASTLQFIKSSDGMVHVFGTIKDGTFTNGTVITTLPAGFRPSEIVRGVSMSENAGTPAVCEVAIESTGVMTVNFANGNTRLNINFTFPASNLANGVSLE